MDSKRSIVVLPGTRSVNTPHPPPHPPPYGGKGFRA